MATDDGPTRGAFEQADDARWEASPVGAFVVRLLVVVGPIAGAFLGLLLLAEVLIRPPGAFGLVVWMLQSVVIGTVISMTLERLTRGLLPLATLFTMSLMFPDQAPSRYGVALRSGTLRRLAEQAKGDETKLLGDDVASASVRAVEYITALGRHDRLTRGHTERVRAYAELIGAQMGLSEADRAKLTWGVMLHDIGKMSVPPEILNKPGKLTDEEWTALKGHPEAGGRMLTPLRDWLGPWALAASEHHERWDGGGYPRGLKGEEISLAGRITAVADAYDVITSKRSYKAPMSPAAARRELVVCSGTQFDPDVVRAFLNVSLRRRWSGGFLAALSNLPVGNLGSAPVAVTIGAVVAGGAVVSGMPPPEVAETLAFGDVPSIVEQDTTTTEPVTTVTSPPVSGPTSSVDVSTVEATTSTSAIATSTTGASGSSSTTATTTVSSTAAPTTAPPTSAGPTTTAPTTTTTAPPTTTTAPPTTTTTAPTTTTTGPTTTTGGFGTVLYLKNPGTGASPSQWYKPLEAAGPDNSTLPDYNTDDGDGRPGSWFEPTDLVSGFEETDPGRIEAWRVNHGTQVMSGPTQLTVWLATDTDLASPVTVEADIASCWLVTFCTSVAQASADVSTWVGDGWQQVTFDFGSPSYTFAWDHELVVRLVTRGADNIHVAFDADSFPSRLGTQLS